MNRDEFVAYAENLDDKILLDKACEMRLASEQRIPNEIKEQFRKLDDKTSVEEIYVTTAFGNTHLFIIRPNKVINSQLPIVINVHGGGWCLPHAERDIYLCRRIAVKCKCLVIDIDYVLAPEFPYPSAILEIEALLNELPVLSSKWNGDINNILFCGQSAGGNLVAAVCQRKRFPSVLNLRSQILCYFPADNFENHFGDKELSEREISSEYYGFFYNKKFDDRKISDVSLVYASKEDILNLPKTHIILCGQDPLMPEGKKYYYLLKGYSADVTYKIFQNSHHGFLVNLYDEWQEGENYLTQLIIESLN